MNDPSPGLRPNALVLGASGGLGGAFVERLAKTHRVIAASRRSAAPATPAAAWIEIDYTPESLDGLAARVRAETDSLDLVVCTIGLLHDRTATPEKRLADLNEAALLHYFHINSVLPMLLLRALVPVIPRRRESRLAFLSARVGSISDNRLGGWYGYRASKAALVMLIRSAAIELARSHPAACLVALHPGTVATPLSEPFVRRHENVLTPSESAGHLLKVLDGLTHEHSGGAFDWRGEPIPY